MADISVDEWIKRWLAGEWVPSAVVEQNGKLHKRIAQDGAVWSVAMDAYRIKGEGKRA